MNYFDIRCLDRPVAIRAVFLLWRRRAWADLDELGLGQEIDEGFDDASMDIPGYRIKNDTQTEAFMAALPLSLQERVILAADILIDKYRYAYREEIAADAYLQTENRYQFQANRKRRRQ